MEELEAIKQNVWSAAAYSLRHGLGLLGYMMWMTTEKGRKRAARAREDAAHSRRVKGPWRNSNAHAIEAERRLLILMRRTKRKDRRAYVLYRDLRESSKRGDQAAYTKAVEAYKAYLKECRKSMGKKP